MAGSRRLELDEACFMLGAAYYALARSTASSLLEPIYISLFRESINYLLKGCVAKRARISEGSVQFADSLSDEWQSFKALEKDTKLSRFDHVIAALGKFGEIKTPTDIFEAGVHCSILLQKDALPNPMNSINVAALDDLVQCIFEKSHIPASIYFEHLDPRLTIGLPNSFTDL